MRTLIKWYLAHIQIGTTGWRRASSTISGLAWSLKYSSIARGPLIITHAQWQREFSHKQLPFLVLFVEESEREDFARRERVSQKWPSRASPCLVVEREDGVLVDVVGGHDRQRLEPPDLELLRDRHEGLARHLQM